MLSTLFSTTFRHKLISYLFSKTFEDQCKASYTDPLFSMTFKLRSFKKNLPELAPMLEIDQSGPATLIGWSAAQAECSCSCPPNPDSPQIPNTDPLFSMTFKLRSFKKNLLELAPTLETDQSGLATLIGWSVAQAERRRSCPPNPDSPSVSNTDPLFSMTFKLRFFKKNVVELALVVQREQGGRSILIGASGAQARGRMLLPHRGSPRPQPAPAGSPATNIR
jgi:hypothetical protein